MTADQPALDFPMNYDAIMATTLTSRLHRLLTLRAPDREHPMSRTSLVYLLNAPDREIREAVALLRESGVPVIAHPEGGYYISREPDDLRYLCRQCDARIIALARTRRRFEKQVPQEPPKGQRILDLLEVDEEATP